jgi:hypothetical protein
VLGLSQLATPASLEATWQQDILPACLSAWEVLLLELSQQKGEHLSQQEAASVLLQLDALLGTCQQVSRVPYHTKQAVC